jgi:hypothetical protein
MTKSEWRIRQWTVDSCRAGSEKQLTTHAAMERAWRLLVRGGGPGDFTGRPGHPIHSALFHPFPPAGNFGAAAPPDIHALRRYNLLP